MDLVKRRFWNYEKQAFYIQLYSRVFLFGHEIVMQKTLIKSVNILNKFDR